MFCPKRPEGGLLKSYRPAVLDMFPSAEVKDLHIILCRSIATEGVKVEGLLKGLGL